MINYIEKIYSMVSIPAKKLVHHIQTLPSLLENEKFMSFIEKSYSLTSTLVSKSLELVENIPKFLEKTLKFIVSILDILVTFIVGIYNSIKPLIIVLIPVFSTIFSYRLLLKSAIYFGVVSKITVKKNNFKYNKMTSSIERKEI